MGQAAGRSRPSVGVALVGLGNYATGQMDAFARCILEDRTSRVAGTEGLRDLEAIEAIYASVAAGGQRVEVPSGA